MSNLKRYRRDIVEALNGDIILRYAYNSGVLQHSAATDSSVAQAVELLLNREEYERILNQQHLEMH
jgi:carboxyl-terminal processing protease